jgi:hypothetical protein
LSEIVGVKPESPGFKDVRIEPNTIDLQRAKGAVATPLGAVSVEWKKDDTKFELQFSVPDGCRSVTVALPQGKKYLLDNRKITPNKLIDGKAYFVVESRNKTMTVVSK